MFIDTEHFNELTGDPPTNVNLLSYINCFSTYKSISSLTLASILLFYIASFKFLLSKARFVSSCALYSIPFLPGLENLIQSSDVLFDGISHSLFIFLQSYQPIFPPLFRSCKSYFFSVCPVSLQLTDGLLFLDRFLISSLFPWQLYFLWR